MSTFPSGARVLVDGRDIAIVRQAFPEGSSSYLFPHYKLDIVGGDRNVAVSMSRVGVVAKKNRALSSSSKRSAMVSGLTLADYEAMARQQQRRGPTGTLAMESSERTHQTVAMTPGGTIVMNRAKGNRANSPKRTWGQWGFVARRGSDSKHVYVKRELAEQIAESPAGTRQDYLALWLVPPFYMDAGEGIFRTRGGLPPAWDYMRGKLELPEDFLRDPNAWLERVKREDFPTYEKHDVAKTREWKAKDRANRALSQSQQRRRREVLKTTVDGRPYTLVPIVETNDYSAETGSTGGTSRARIATSSDEVWEISDNRLVVSAGGKPIGVVVNWGPGSGKNPWTLQTIGAEEDAWLRLSGMLQAAPSRAEAIAKGERVIAGRARYSPDYYNRAGGTDAYGHKWKEIHPRNVKVGDYIHMVGAHGGDIRGKVLSVSKRRAHFSFGPMYVFETDHWQIQHLSFFKDERMRVERDSSNNSAGVEYPSGRTPAQRLRYFTKYHLDEGYHDEGGFHHVVKTKEEAERVARITMHDEEAYYAQRPHADEGFDEDLPSDAMGRL